MAVSDTISETGFKSSVDTIEASDPRDACIKTLAADCARLRELAWALRPLFAADDAARRDVANGKITVDDLLTIHDRFTTAEDELNRLAESIETRLHAWNRGKPIPQRIYISHTAEGLPIAPSASRKTPFWGL